MTREEAITVLKGLLDNPLFRDTANLLEALEQEPSSSENPTGSTTKNDLAVKKIIDEVEKEIEKVDIPSTDKLIILAKVQNALYKCAVSDNSEVEE